MRQGYIDPVRGFVTQDAPEYHQPPTNSGPDGQPTTVWGQPTTAGTPFQGPSFEQAAGIGGGAGAAYGGASAGDAGAAKWAGRGAAAGPAFWAGNQVGNQVYDGIKGTDAYNNGLDRLVDQTHTPTPSGVETYPVDLSMPEQHPLPSVPSAPEPSSMPPVDLMGVPTGVPMDSMF
jgi:hypothetical protein